MEINRFNEQTLSAFSFCNYLCFAFLLACNYSLNFCKNKHTRWQRKTTLRRLVINYFFDLKTYIILNKKNYYVDLDVIQKIRDSNSYLVIIIVFFLQSRQDYLQIENLKKEDRKTLRKTLIKKRLGNVHIIRTHLGGSAICYEAV